ncbi:glycerol kinase GlpK [Pseudophaeobacter sp.]|uniref:glycerol kinase GlpK n=1 Tax=Pseudophaeobacter sp. TaxID=1971739 RepID=UPI0032988E47
MKYILAIDQGTTSTRAVLFDADMQAVGTAQQEFPQYFPKAGWVEHDLEEVWDSVVATCRQVLAEQGIEAADLAGIGITNQRETTAVWEKAGGKPIHRAIVWQDRRTVEICEGLRAAGHEEMIRHKTGLLLDPYFSGTKVRWILDQEAGSRSRAEAGELLFGTIDSFLIWRLTGGASHVTDATNASRTMLYDIRAGTWSAEICQALDVPMQMLPEVKDCAAEFGMTLPEILGVPVPILGVAGDQQAATIGQACFEPGMMKSTYGTGCFALLNTGETPVTSNNRLLTTVAYQLEGKPVYALEGSIFIAGAAVQWLRDGLGVIEAASQSGALARQADPEQDVLLVPAFTGLGAPYWQPDCRGAVFGLTRGSGPAEMARAALQSVAYQTRDLWEAMRADWPAKTHVTLRVDGGMSASDWTMQSLSDLLGAAVDRPKMQETTALGAGWLAGMQAGLYPDQAGFAATWALDHQFTPQLEPERREAAYARWQRAVQAVIGV